MVGKLYGAKGEAAFGRVVFLRSAPTRQNATLFLGPVEEGRVLLLLLLHPNSRRRPLPPRMRVLLGRLSLSNLHLYILHFALRVKHPLLLRRAPRGSAKQKIFQFETHNLIFVVSGALQSAGRPWGNRCGNSVREIRGGTSFANRNPLQYLPPVSESRKHCR